MYRVLTSAVVAMGVVAGGCGDTVELELKVPSQDTFVRSSTVEVLGVPLAAGETGRCPGLVMDVELSPGMLGADFETGRQPICSLRDGSFRVPGAPERLYAYVAATRNERGVAYVTGCTVQHVSEGQDRLLIVLSPTEAYRTDFGGMPTSGCTVEQKCGGGCP